MPSWKSHNSGDTAWVLASAALVLLMTPGLALFYGGMVRAKCVLNMMMMSFGAMGTVGVVWVLWGYSDGVRRRPSVTASSATPSSTSASTARPDCGRVASSDTASLPRPSSAFQAVFAIITVALISGAIADRAKFGAWTRLHRSGPRSSTSRSPTGCSPSTASRPRQPAAGSPTEARQGPIDFAGGTVVHINAGIGGPGARAGRSASASASARSRCARTTCRSSCSAPACCGSAGSGSTPAPRSRPTAPPASPGSTPSPPPCAAMLGWLARGEDPRRPRHLARRRVRCRRRPRRHHPGLRRAHARRLDRPRPRRRCALRLAVGLKFRFGYDDSLDVVGVHLVGGLVGTIGVGFLAGVRTRRGRPACSTAAGSTSSWRQTLGALAVLRSPVVVTLRHRPGPQGDHRVRRIAEDDEIAGIDLHEHAETGYDLGGYIGGRVGVRRSIGRRPPRHPSKTSKELNA